MPAHHFCHMDPLCLYIYHASSYCGTYICGSSLEEAIYVLQRRSRISQIGRGSIIPEFLWRRQSLVKKSKKTEFNEKIRLILLDYSVEKSWKQFWNRGKPNWEMNLRNTLPLKWKLYNFWQSSFKWVQQFPCLLVFEWKGPETTSTPTLAKTFI